jgi:ATP-dependent DNA helicase RecG
LQGSEKPTYASILLYDEVPSASLPKKCVVKINRYRTSDLEPKREHLERQETIEANLYDQIEQSIKVIQEMIESVPIIGATGLEKAKYPPEAIKEVLVNAIIHRDYNISDDVLVFIFNNRIEVHSPGCLPGHITKENILHERYSRNPKIVRLLNKYPEPPNKDIGEGLNTAFQKMRAVRLKEPSIEIKDNKVIVTLPHQALASPEDQILEYLKHNSEINNKTTRDITGIGSENQVKRCFIALAKRGLIERVPKKLGGKASWQLKSTII